MQRDGGSRREFTGRLRPDGDDPPGLRVTFEVDEGQVRVTGPTGELATWALGDVGMTARGDELVFTFGDETIIGLLDDRQDAPWLMPPPVSPNAFIRYGVPVVLGLAIAAAIFSFVG